MLVLCHAWKRAVEEELPEKVLGNRKPNEVKKLHVVCATEKESVKHSAKFILLWSLPWIFIPLLSQNQAVQSPTFDFLKFCVSVVLPIITLPHLNSTFTTFSRLLFYLPLRRSIGINNRLGQVFGLFSASLYSHSYWNSAFSIIVTFNLLAYCIFWL